MPSDKILTTCLRAHKDGFGMMVRTGERVTIYKGLFDLPHILKIVKRVPKNSEASFHFRLATHGTVSAGNCHPFPVTCRNDALTTPYGVFDSGLMHNGIISGFGSRNDSKLSDTMNFIKYLKKATRGVYTYKRVGHFIEGHYGKFVMFMPGWTYFYGDFVEDKPTGLKFSNHSYKDFGNFVYDKAPKNDIKYGHWDVKLQKMVYDKPKKNHTPMVQEVLPEHIKWTEGTEIAECFGRYGDIVEYKGVFIFCEFGYLPAELDFLKDDIAIAMAEGEYEMGPYP